MMGMFLRLENNSGLYTGGNYLVREEKIDDAGAMRMTRF